MRASIASKHNTALAHLCAACRRQSASSLSTTRNPSTPVPNVRSLGSHQVQPSITRRYLSQTPTRRIDNSGSAPESETAAATAESTTATSSPTSPSPQVPSGPPSYYALFPETLPHGPPPAGPFHIDVRALRREFLRLQAASHPDFHAHSSASSASRRRAEAASALINGAFRTLSNPLLRAQYLLREQFGLDLAGDEAGSIAAAEEDVLDQVLEAREVIEEATSEADLAGLREENERRIRESEERIGRAFAGGDVEALKREVVRLRYWVNIREGIDNWEPGRPVVLEH